MVCSAGRRRKPSILGILNYTFKYIKSRQSIFSYLQFKTAQGLIISLKISVVVGYTSTLE